MMQGESKPAASLLLAIDTCGPAGSVALGRRDGRGIELLGEIELAGRTYSATVVAAVGELLRGAGVEVRDLGGIVAVHGPGSFTGVRVGLSSVKGLAEGAAIPVEVISRLEVLAWKASVRSSALDAHRGEVFLRMEGKGSGATEIVAGARELEAMAARPERLAVCDESAAALLAAAWRGTELIKVEAPLASDALRAAEAMPGAGAWVDLALLDGNYLRRSDAEIFGNEVLAPLDAAESKGK